MSKNTGGPAFPRDHANDGHNGMTLRDYFAAKAMAALIQESGPNLSRAVWANIRDLAAASYLFADAMLKEREQ